MFEPGDKVVCIKLDSPCLCGYKLDALGSGSLPMVVGRYYTVRDVGLGWCPICLCIEPGFQPVGLEGRWTWPQQNFRKIEPGSEDIFSLATTKVKEPV